MVNRLRRWGSGVQRLAAALNPRACSQRYLPNAETSLCRQQAGLGESGSKLPHSRRTGERWIEMTARQSTVQRLVVTSSNLGRSGFMQFAHFDLGAILRKE